MTARAIRIMKRLFLPSLALCALLAPCSRLASAQAGEDGKEWRFSIQQGNLKAITLKDPAVRGRYRSYWYLILEIRNKTGADRRLDLGARAEVPHIKKGRIARPGFYPSVTKAIAKREGIRGLKNLLAVSGTIQDGKSEKLVVIFPHLSHYANRIDVRLTGCANRIIKIGKKLWSQSVEYSVRFHRVGDEFHTTTSRVEKKGSRWVTVRKRLVRGR